MQGDTSEILGSLIYSVARAKTPGLSVSSCSQNF